MYKVLTVGITLFLLCSSTLLLGQEKSFLDFHFEQVTAFYTEENVEFEQEEIPNPKRDVLVIEYEGYTKIHYFTPNRLCYRTAYMAESKEHLRDLIAYYNDNFKKIEPDVWEAPVDTEGKWGKSSADTAVIKLEKMIKTVGVLYAGI